MQTTHSRIVCTHCTGRRTASGRAAGGRRDDDCDSARFVYSFAANNDGQGASVRALTWLRSYVLPGNIDYKSTRKPKPKQYPESDRLAESKIVCGNAGLLNFNAEAMIR